MGEAATAPVAHAQRLLAAAVVVAACQIGLSARLEYADDYQLTLAIGWFGALFVAWQRGSSAIGSNGLGLGVAGAVTAIGSVVAMAWATGYHSFYRTLPLVAGIGLALAAAGARAWAAYRGPLFLLALPLLNSPPKLLHSMIDPVLIPATTWCAMALSRVAGHAIVADGHLLRMPHETLDIVDGCSGLWAITRLFVLAALVVALFPTTMRQRVVLLASAFVVGFCLNAVRVAVLAATVLDHDEGGFTYWHQGTGATFFALGASAAAGLAWWLMLRRGLAR